MRAGTRILVGFAVGVVGAAVMAGCASSGSPGAAGAPAGEKLAVVATTTQVADFVRNVGGDKVTVTQIIKPNVDPHDYEPTPADIAADRQGQARREERRRPGEVAGPDGRPRPASPGTVVDASQGVTIRKGDRGGARRATRTSGTTRATPRSWRRTSRRPFDRRCRQRDHLQAEPRRLPGQAGHARRRHRGEDQHDSRRVSASW